MEIQNNLNKCIKYFENDSLFFTDLKIAWNSVVDIFKSYESEKKKLKIFVNYVKILIKLNIVLSHIII